MTTLIMEDTLVGFVRTAGRVAGQGVMQLLHEVVCKHLEAATPVKPVAFGGKRVPSLAPICVIVLISNDDEDEEVNEIYIYDVDAGEEAKEEMNEESGSEDAEEGDDGVNEDNMWEDTTA
ncbi:hypothetical protein GUJ93_ZPchr0002g26515 [Zizania palustris]|uniref:Uncharacterized protein n=1 Tax=Zizania palustris TaxID=103762 RepID=A0A8J5S6S2_ZIZPA|nr:hypothetical protein GUJ93_ZPchr0002g26515 [Zizania palustris]